MTTQDNTGNGSEDEPILVLGATSGIGARTGKAQVLRALEQWPNGLVSRRDAAAYPVAAVIDGLERRGDVVLAK